MSSLVSPTFITPPSPALKYAVPSTRKSPFICTLPSVVSVFVVIPFAIISVDVIVVICAAFHE